MQRTIRTSALFTLLALAPALLGAEPIETALERIKKVGREGQGNAEAASAWRELARQDPDKLPTILAAFDGADATAANWLRAAVDAIAERELTAGRTLSAAPLEKFVKDTGHDGQARRLAYEWLVRVDATAPARLLPAMLEDPGAELRRDAVAGVLQEGKDLFNKKDRAAAAAAYGKALFSARDRDQVELAIKQLKALGINIDVPNQYGFVRSWQIIGPFDNTEGKGFDPAYPPEKAIELSAEYEGKKNAHVRWIEHTSSDPYGIVDFNKTLGKHMGAVAYAYAVVDSPVERPVQVRAGSYNAVKIFLNGKQIFFRDEYHHNMRVDQHIGTGTLRAGKNDILIKVCQNEQKESWAQSWLFQLRLSDALGAAVPFTVDTPKSKTALTERKAQP